MKNEKELLRLYCVRDGHRPVLQHPFPQDGRICASDGHMLIRIDAARCEGDYPEPVDGLKAPNTNKVVPQKVISEPLTRRQLEKALKQTPEEEFRLCPDCGGDGRVEWEYTDHGGECHHHLDTCPVCDGSGEMSDYTAIRYQYLLHGAALRYHHLKVLLASMDCLGIDTITIRNAPWVDGDTHSPSILLTADGVEILLVPYQRDYKLDGIEIT